MSNIKRNYQRILEIILPLSSQITLPVKAGRKPKMSDIEVVALSLTAEYMSIDSENSLFKQLQSSPIINLLERSQYNKRRRHLFNYSEILRKKLTIGFEQCEDHFIVDSMPLEICKFSRHNRIKICKEDFYTSPEKGFCAAQNQLFYGYKIHAACTFSGVITGFDVTKANVHDIHYLADVKHQLADCVLIGDKGYLSASHQIDLFNQANIRLETPRRANQVHYKKQPYIYRKTRKKIETLFSQLCDQFMIRRNYAKSFLGFKTRILAKISALTLVQYINKFIFDRNINNIKIEII